MATNNSTISPYLRRPLRSYEEVIRSRWVKTAQATSRDASVASHQIDDEAATSEIPKWNPRRKGEARR